jgi:hypothetical protein
VSCGGKEALVVVDGSGGGGRCRVGKEARSGLDWRHLDSLKEQPFECDVVKATYK